MNRRSFLLLTATSVAATPADFVGAFANAPSRSSASPAYTSAWYATMRRCGQINYNEQDPLTMNVDAWGDYWASLKVDAVLLNGGGILAFYPTQVPYHRRSQFLGTRDLFGEMVAAMKRRGIRAVARMDCNLAYEDALKAHPEWRLQSRLRGCVESPSRVVRTEPGWVAQASRREPLAVCDLHV